MVVHTSVLDFGKRCLGVAEIAGQRVLEVGACNVNGSLRAHVEELLPRLYLGVDIVDGPGVDVICDAGDLVGNLMERFGLESFDLVICTEMLEHCRDWQAAVSNMKRVCQPGGLILLTVRGPGFPRHHPPDHWRFTWPQAGEMFADCELLVHEGDPQRDHPGVFILARKPADFVEQDYLHIEPMGVECASY